MGLVAQICGDVLLIAALRRQMLKASTCVRIICKIGARHSVCLRVCVPVCVSLRGEMSPRASEKQLVTFER